MSALTPIGSRFKNSDDSFSDLSDCGSQGSEYGYSVLHEAVISRDLEYLDFLLKVGCDLEQRDENGFTALHVATLEKSVDAVDRLVRAGSNVSSLTKEGMSSLHIAVEIQGNSEVIALLASSSCSIDIRNKVGRTALHLAARCGDLQYLKTLLDAGCDREIKDKFGKKAVDAARARGHEECVQFLLLYIPQKRNLKTFGNKQNGDEKPSNIKKKLLTNGIDRPPRDKSSGKDCNTRETSSLSLNKKSDGFKMEREVLKLKEQERKINGEHSLAVREIVIREMSDGKVKGRAVVGLEIESRELQPQIATTIDGKIMYPENLIAEQESGVSDLGKIKFPFDFNFNEVESRKETKTQINKKKKDVNVQLDTCERNSLMKKGLDDKAMNEQLDSSKTDSTSKTLPVSPAILINGNNEHSTDAHDLSPTSVEKAPFKTKADLPEISSKLHPSNISTKFIDNSLNGNQCFPLHKTITHVIDPKEMHNVLTRISQPKKMELSNLSRCKEEIKILQAIIPLPLFSVKLKDEDFLRPLESHRTVMNGWAIKTITNHDLRSIDIVSKVLKGLKKSICSITWKRNNIPLELDEQNHCKGFLQDCKNQRSQITGCERENVVQLFIRACQIIKMQPSLAHEILEEVCGIISSKDKSEFITLTERLFTCGNLFKCRIQTNDEYSIESQLHTNLDGFLLTLDYVIRHSSTPVLFLSAVLNSFITHQEWMVVVMTTRPELIEFVLAQVISSDEAIWDEDKVAEMFLLFCRTLEDEPVLLCRYVDVLLDQALSRCDFNNIELSSRILVRMGLLKSELYIIIISNLRGPLIALKHVFTQDYFPRSLASLFVSFLAKPSPRFAKLEDLHCQALKSAILKEILPQSNNQDVNVLGKGLKRICDVLARGDYWETAYHCCDVLFVKVFESTKFKPMELGESILVYFGLMKSEVKLETIRNSQNGLKLLQHAANANRIPQSIAIMLVVFLNKESSRIRLEPYKDDFECLLKILRR